MFDYDIEHRAFIPQEILRRAILFLGQESLKRRVANDTESNGLHLFSRWPSTSSNLKRDLKRKPGPKNWLNPKTCTVIVRNETIRC